MAKAEPKSEQPSEKRPVISGADTHGASRRQLALRILAAVVVLASAGILLRGLLTPAAPPPSASATPGPAAPELGHYAPDVTLTDLSGRGVKLSSWRGQVVVLNFWYVACEPCRLEMPALERDYLDQRANGVVVLGVNTADDAATIQQFTSKLGITYPIVRDPDLHATSAFRLAATPTTFVIDRAGVIRYKFVGPLDRATLAKDLTVLVGKR
jgi:peroxiredoxin